MAKLYFRYGAMNSGKSTALMQVAHNYEEQGMQVLILKPQVDTKGGDELVSRLGVRRKADLLVPPEVDVFEAVRTAGRQQKLACVLCDESQFFTPKQNKQLDTSSCGITRNFSDPEFLSFKDEKATAQALEKAADNARP